MARIGSPAQLGRPGSAARAGRCRLGGRFRLHGVVRRTARRADDYNIDAGARSAPPGDSALHRMTEPVGHITGRAAGTTGQCAFSRAGLRAEEPLRTMRRPVEYMSNFRKWPIPSVTLKCSFVRFK